MNEKGHIRLCYDVEMLRIRKFPLLAKREDLKQEISRNITTEKDLKPNVNYWEDYRHKNRLRSNTKDKDYNIEFKKRSIVDYEFKYNSNEHQETRNDNNDILKERTTAKNSQIETQTRYQVSRLVNRFSANKDHKEGVLKNKLSLKVESKASKTELKQLSNNNEISIDSDIKNQHLNKAEKDDELNDKSHQKMSVLIDLNERENISEQLKSTKKSSTNSLLENNDNNEMNESIQVIIGSLEQLNKPFMNTPKNSATEIGYEYSTSTEEFLNKNERLSDSEYWKKESDNLEFKNEGLETSLENGSQYSSNMNNLELENNRLLDEKFEIEKKPYLEKSGEFQARNRSIQIRLNKLGEQFEDEKKPSLVKNEEFDARNSTYKPTISKKINPLLNTNKSKESGANKTNAIANNHDKKSLNLKSKEKNIGNLNQFSIDSIKNLNEINRNENENVNGNKPKQKRSKSSTSKTRRHVSKKIDAFDHSNLIEKNRSEDLLKQREIKKRTKVKKPIIWDANKSITDASSDSFESTSRYLNIDPSYLYDGGQKANETVEKLEPKNYTQRRSSNSKEVIKLKNNDKQMDAAIINSNLAKSEFKWPSLIQESAYKGFKIDNKQREINKESVENINESFLTEKSDDKMREIEFYRNLAMEELKNSSNVFFNGWNITRAFTYSYFQLPAQHLKKFKESKEFLESFFSKNLTRS